MPPNSLLHSFGPQVEDLSEFTCSVMYLRVGAISDNTAKKRYDKTIFIRSLLENTDPQDIAKRGADFVTCIAQDFC